MQSPISDPSKYLLFHWERGTAEALYYGGMVAAVLAIVALLGGITPAILVFVGGMAISFYHHPMMDKNAPALMFAEEGIGIRGFAVVTWQSIDSIAIRSTWLRTIEQRFLVITLKDDVALPRPSLTSRMQISLTNLKPHTVEVKLTLLKMDDEAEQALDALLRECGDKLDMG